MILTEDMLKDMGVGSIIEFQTIDSFRTHIYVRYSKNWWSAIHLDHKYQNGSKGYSYSNAQLADRDYDVIVLKNPVDTEC